MAKNESLKPSYWTGLCGDILKKYHCRVVSVEQTKAAHVKIILQHRRTGKTIRMNASLTPSDHRVHKKRRTTCRMKCRELDAQTGD